MTGRTNQQAVERLADVLVEDILNTSGDQLLAEVAEDYGNPRTLAETFDKIALKAKSDNPRSVSPALAAAATRVVAGSPPQRRSYLAGKQRTFWQNPIQSILDAIFPNRLVMIAVSSACIASLGFIVAAPAVFDWMQERSGGSEVRGRPAGPQTPEPAGERGAPSLTPAAPSFRGLDLPSDTNAAGEQPAVSAAGPDGAQEGRAQEDRAQEDRAQDKQDAASPAPETTSSPPAVREGAARDASAPAADSYVQVSTQRTKANAEAAVRNLQAKFAKELGDHKTMIRRADLGANGVYYRALVGPFGSAGDAERFCSSLKAAGGRCTIQKE